MSKNNKITNKVKFFSDKIRFLKVNGNLSEPEIMSILIERVLEKKPEKFITDIQRSLIMDAMYRPNSTDAQTISFLKRQIECYNENKLFNTEMVLVYRSDKNLK
jgi:hypothetical protein